MSNRINRIIGSLPYSKRRVILLGVLFLLVITLTLVLTHLHSYISSSLGPQVAMLITAAVVAWVTFIFTIGVGLGGLVELSVCKRILFFKNPPRPGSSLDLFLKLWGHKIETKDKHPADSKDNDLPLGVTMTDVEELLAIVGTRQRRGKKSQYPDEIRFRAVRDWMILQANGTSLTLQQFLEERFGVASETGMPLVPNQTFYGWRTQFIKELETYRDKKSRKK